MVVLPTQIGNIGTTSCMLLSTNLLAVSCTKSASTVKARLIFNDLTAGN